MNRPSALPRLDHLGVARHHRNAGGATGASHAADDASEISERKPFLEDEGGGQIERAGAAHGDVVDGAMRGQRTDISAGEEQGRDNICVGGDDNSAGGRRHHRHVVTLSEKFIVQSAGEKF